MRNVSRLQQHSPNTAARREDAGEERLDRGGRGVCARARRGLTRSDKQDARAQRRDARVASKTRKGGGEPEGWMNVWSPFRLPFFSI